jgi:CubicO group peptidase (beta-lactamase class C family)
LRRRILRGVLWTLLAAIIAFNLYVLITGQTYAYKALVYQGVGIYDYEIFENREIPKGAPQPWPKAQRYNQKPLPEKLQNLHKNLETVAYVVVRGDSLVHESYYGDHQPEMISNSFSMSKSFVSLLAGIAEAEGKLSLDDRVGKYLPFFNEKGKENITLRHLLTMSSGLRWDEGYAQLFSETTEGYYGGDLPGQLAKVRMEHQPGTVCYYKGSDPQALALALEKATGKTLSQYFSEKIWQPIGTEQPALWCLDEKNGHEKAYCCINATARDFARLGRLVLRDGNWNGKQLVPKDYLRKALTPVGLPDETGQKTDYYGYQWWFAEYKGQPVYYARGILGQYILVYPAADLVVVRLGHKRGEQRVGAHLAEMYDYLEGALAL